MTTRRPTSPTTEPYTEGGDPGAPWSAALEELRTASTFWLATTHPRGRPHVVPVLAVVSDDTLYLAAGPGTQKARNLARDPRVTVTTQGENLDLVVDGEAHVVRDDRVLARVAEAYADRYGWSVEIRDGSFHGDGAPTAGPPPYDVHRVTPHRAFGFPSAGAVAPTRWRFRSAPPAGAG